MRGSRIIVIKSYFLSVCLLAGLFVCYDYRLHVYIFCFALLIYVSFLFFFARGGAATPVPSLNTAPRHDTIIQANCGQRAQPITSFFPLLTTKSYLVKALPRPSVDPRVVGAGTVSLYGPPGKQRCCP